MAIGPCIDDDRLRGIGGLLDPCDQIAFVIALPAVGRDAQRLGFRRNQVIDVGQTKSAVDLRLADTEHIEVRAV